MNIEVPFSSDTELKTRFENWLTLTNYKFRKKGGSFEPVYHIEVETAQDAFWIGCNITALTYKLFDSPLTRTLG